MNLELNAPQHLIERLKGIDDPTALLDSYGRIVAVNSLWRGSAETSSHVASEDGVGKDYLAKDFFDALGLGDVLSEQEGGKAGGGIRAVLKGCLPHFSSRYLVPGEAGPVVIQLLVDAIDSAGERWVTVSRRALAEAGRREESLSKELTDLVEAKERLHAENLYLQDEVRLEHNFEEIVGNSAGIRKVFSQIEQVASTDATVLIIGETGTGKELVARAIHARSTRRQHAMVKVNCAALPATLIESELFGHEKGAFTGALTRVVGRFELANNGTIFLDEVGDLPLELQSKLLRVLQEGEFERLGSTTTIKVNVRVLAATNRNLETLIDNGSFRADLYYRLNVFPIEVPPLRERRDDIVLLVWYFLTKHRGSLGKIVDTIGQRDMSALLSYSWPGNVRELENRIERALIGSTGRVLAIEGSPLGFVPPSAHHNSEGLDDVQRAHITAVLELCDWKVKGKGNAADRLGLNSSTLRARMKHLGIIRPNPSS
jgi:formate hydrogenlyase transcriptional activator